MNFEIDINRFAKEITREIFEQVRGPVQDAMAYRFAELTDSNFDGDVCRPLEWRPLGEHYAIEYHDGDQTPTLQLYGALRQSIRDGLSPSSKHGGDYAEVSTDIEYASEHQWGDPSRGLPARPFLPLTGTPENYHLTDFAESEILMTAQLQMEHSLKQF